MNFTVEDIDLIRTIDEKLQAGKTPKVIAHELGIPPATLRANLDRLGYYVEINRRLVPKRAPSLEELAS